MPFSVTITGTPGVARREAHRVAERLGVHLPAGLHGRARRRGPARPGRGRGRCGSRSGRRRSRRPSRRRASRAGRPSGPSARRSSPPSPACRSTSASVQPTLASPGPDLIASTPARWTARHPLDVHPHQAHLVAGGVVAADAAGAASTGPASGPRSPAPIGITPVSCEHGDDVRLVERRDPRHEVAEVLGRPGRVAPEPLGRRPCSTTRPGRRTSEGW